MIWVLMLLDQKFIILHQESCFVPSCDLFCWWMMSQLILLLLFDEYSSLCWDWIMYYITDRIHLKPAGPNGNKFLQVHNHLLKSSNAFQAVHGLWHHFPHLGGIRQGHARSQFHKGSGGPLVAFCYSPVSSDQLRRHWWLSSALLLVRWGRAGLRLWYHTYPICCAGLISCLWTLPLWCCTAAPVHPISERGSLLWYRPVQILPPAALPIAGRRRRRRRTQDGYGYVSFSHKKIIR